jgi:hypothetical protein
MSVEKIVGEIGVSYESALRASSVMEAGIRPRDGNNTGKIVASLLNAAPDGRHADRRSEAVAVGHPDIESTELRGTRAGRLSRARE